MKKEFTHEMTDEIKEIIRKYLDCELIKKDFEKLKKIVNKHCICFNFLKNVEPVRYDSVKTMFLDAEMSNIDFDNAYKKFHLVFKSLPETQLETLNYIGMDENSANIPVTIKSDKDIRCIKNTLIHICGASDRNRYKIETYSPFYSYFLFKRSTFTLKEYLNSTEFNKLVGYMNEVKNNINVEKRENDKTYKGLNSTENILLFEYLSERGLGTKYKYYTFMYLQKFIDDFEKLFPKLFKREDYKSIYKAEFITLFIMLRSVCLFATKDFFETAYSVVFELLAALLKFTNDYDKYPQLNNEVVYHLSTGIFSQILCEVYEYENTELNILHDVDIDIDDFKFEEKIIIPDSMSHYWKQIQFLVNKYIDIDFKETIFGIEPSNILATYQADILKEKSRNAAVLFSLSNDF